MLEPDQELALQTWPTPSVARRYRGWDEPPPNHHPPTSALDRSATPTSTWSTTVNPYPTITKIIRLPNGNSRLSRFTAVLTFVIAFGLAKAITNLAAGRCLTDTAASQCR